MTAPSPATLLPSREASWFGATQPNPAGYREATPTQVAELMAARRLASQAPDEATTYLIDVREPDEFIGELGHIQGAVLAPLASLLAAAPNWPPQAMLVFVCRSGGRSGRAAAAYAALGHPLVVNMVGGMLAYRDAGLPATR